MMRLLSKYPSKNATVKGCAVGLATKNGIPIGKGWTIFTTNHDLAATLNKLRFTKNHDHDKCLGAVARDSERYTDKHAQIVAKAIAKPVTRNDVMALAAEAEQGGPDITDDELKLLHRRKQSGMPSPPRSRRTS